MGKFILVSALFFQSCASFPGATNLFMDLARGASDVIASSDTPPERVARLGRTIARAERWCGNGETGSCLVLPELKKMREELQQQLLSSDN